MVRKQGKKSDKIYENTKQKEAQRVDLNRGSFRQSNEKEESFSEGGFFFSFLAQ